MVSTQSITAIGVDPGESTGYVEIDSVPSQNGSTYYKIIYSRTFDTGSLDRRTHDISELLLRRLRAYVYRSQVHVIGCESYLPRAGVNNMYPAYIEGIVRGMASLSPMAKIVTASPSTLKTKIGDQYLEMRVTSPIKDLTTHEQDALRAAIYAILDVTA